MTPEGSATPAGFEPRMRRFTVSGIFESGMYEYDRGLALMHMSDAAKLYRLGDSVTGLRLALEDPFPAPTLVRTVARAIDYDGNGYFVSDWTRDHANFFRSIELTKSMMFFILLILVVVAAINLVATLVMIVKEKQTDIAILRTIGAAPVNVLRMFLVQGALIGLVGTVAGALLGWLLALNVTSIVHGDRRRVRRKVPGCERVSHERPAFRSAARATCCRCRCVALAARGAGHYLPGVARRRARCRPRPCDHDMKRLHEYAKWCWKPRGVRRAFRQGPIDLAGAAGRESRRARRRTPRDHWRLRVRQDHAAADPRRARPARPRAS